MNRRKFFGIAAAVPSIVSSTTVISATHEARTASITMEMSARRPAIVTASPCPPLVHVEGDIWIDTSRNNLALVSNGREFV